MKGWHYNSATAGPVPVRRSRKSKPNEFGQVYVPVVVKQTVGIFQKGMTMEVEEKALVKR